MSAVTVITLDKEDNDAKGTAGKGSCPARQNALLAAITHFLADGYEKTTTASIAKAAGMSASSFFAAFETKEALLLPLVKHMFSNQFNEIFSIIGGSAEPVMIYAAETSLRLYLSELSEPLRELYVTAYSLPTTSEFIYQNTAKELEQFFAPYNPGDSSRDFYELEIASAGIMRGFMAKPCDVYFTMNDKLWRFLSCCFTLYHVPQSLQEQVIESVLEMDLHTTAVNLVNSVVAQAEAGFEAIMNK